MTAFHIWNFTASAPAFLHSLIIFSALGKLPSQFEPISATRKIFILRFKIEHIKIKIDLKKLS